MFVPYAGPFHVIAEYRALPWHSSLFVHSPVEGCLGRFHTLAIMGKAAINFPSRFLYEHLFSFPLVKYLGAGSLSQVASVHSTL